jgi:hypothetical protein
MPDHVGSGRGAAVPDQLTASREVFMEFKRRTLNHRRHDLRQLLERGSFFVYRSSKFLTEFFEYVD